MNPPESYDVTWDLDSVTMYGTLVKPAGSGPFPAVVMVAGSGPTDREWNSPLLPGSNGSARLIAEELARAGIASLRYDKRASGPHARENMPALAGKLSMQSHLDELSAAVRTLASEDDIRRDRIFGLGNSEGTLHVLQYQVQDPVIPFAGLVLIAPPGRAVGAVAHSQIAEQVSGVPNGDALLPPGVQMLFQGLESSLPFSRELWLADGAGPLSRIDVPVLIVIGKRDVQVDWQADGGPLQRAGAGHKNITFLFPEHANHVLKHEPKLRSELVPAEASNSYNAPDAHLDKEAMIAILEWLRAYI